MSSQPSRESAEWAMQDSNLRPLACRSGGRSLALPYPIGATASVRFDESNDAYHADAAHLNSSRIADLISRGPAFYHARHIAKTHSPAASDGMRHGTRVHLYFELGSAEFSRRIVFLPDEHCTDGGAVSTAKKAREWIAANTTDESILLTVPQWRDLLGQLSAITANPAARSLLESVEWREFSVRWQHDQGHLLRARVDQATPTCWIDLKTTKEARPATDWWKSVRAFGYGFQNAIYRLAARECGWPDDRIHYIVTSNVEPWECCVCTLPVAYVDQCERRVLRALEEIEQRSLLDHWLPDESTKVIELSMPWFTTEEE